MNRIHEFDPVIYPRLLWVTINPSNEELQNFFDDTLDADALRGRKAIVCEASKKKPYLAGYLIVFRSKKYMDIGTIAHEATHVGLDLFHELNIEYDGLHQESLAYLIEWVATCCEQVKKSK